MWFWKLNEIAQYPICMEIIQLHKELDIVVSWESKILGLLLIKLQLLYNWDIYIYACYQWFSEAPKKVLFEVNPFF
jgi:hypothetical protein